MTICDECRKVMLIRTTMIDVSRTKKPKMEEFEFEFCPNCQIAYVGQQGWYIRPQ